jgi:hypothetical protein
LATHPTQKKIVSHFFVARNYKYWHQATWSLRLEDGDSQILWNVGKPARHNTMPSSSSNMRSKYSRE